MSNQNDWRGTHCARRLCWRGEHNSLVFAWAAAWNRLTRRQDSPGCCLEPTALICQWQALALNEAYRLAINTISEFQALKWNIKYLILTLKMPLFLLDCRRLSQLVHSPERSSANCNYTKRSGSWVFKPLCIGCTFGKSKKRKKNSMVKWWSKTSQQTASMCFYKSLELHKPNKIWYVFTWLKIVWG